MSDSGIGEYTKSIETPLKILMDDYENLLNVCVSVTQQAEKFRRKCVEYKQKNSCLLDDLEDMTNKYEASEAKHNISKKYYRNDMQKLQKMKEERNNFWEVIRLCQGLVGDIEGKQTFSDDVSDVASTVSSQNFKQRLSVAQINKLKSFKMENYYDDEEEDLNASRLNRKITKTGITTGVTPRHGRPLGIIEESRIMDPDMTFDSEPDDEPDAHSTQLPIRDFDSPKVRRSGNFKNVHMNFHKNSPNVIKRAPKRYSSDAILSHSTLSTGESSSIAAGFDAGMYQAKKNVPVCVTKRRPSNGFRRKSARLDPILDNEEITNNIVEKDMTKNLTTVTSIWPGDTSTPMTVNKKFKRDIDDSDDLTPTRAAPKIPLESDNKRIKVTPDKGKPPVSLGVKTTPMFELKKNMRRRHEWVHKSSVVSMPKCSITRKKIGFNKSMWRCARCAMIVHPDAFDQAVKTDCQVVPRQPSAPRLRKEVSKDYLPNFTQNQHNMLLLVEEIERRQAIVCEGIYRIPGNIKEQNMLMQKLKSAGNSLRLKRQILATQCKDHNSLCGMLKQYLRDNEPILTYKLCSQFANIACDDKLPATERQKQMTSLLSVLPSTNIQVLSCILRHLKHVIENVNLNKMNEESIARSIGPSLVGYKTKQPTNREFHSAHRYQINVTLCLLSLKNVGNDCVLGRALKKLQDLQKNPPKSSSGNSSGSSLSTPTTFRKMWGR